MEAMLNAWGCEVNCVDGTDSAISFAKKYRPDLVLADFRLANGDEGIRAILEIRNIYPKIPAILISGDTAPARLLEAEAAGLELIHKPIDAASFRRKLPVLLKFGDIA